MFSFKGKTCKPMIERCRIEPHDGKRSAKMFLVTSRARARVLTRMVAGSGGNALAKLGVA
jgi:hypothetical protein